jgi:predicted ATPase/DNA-binding SARP family transcriptional activator
MSLEIRAFGTMKIQFNGVAAERTRTRKELWLLAWLLLHHDREVDRDWLASLFWPDSGEQGALQNLRRSLTNLRAVLGSEAQRLLSPTPRTLRLDVSEADIDVLAFDAAIKRGECDSLKTAVELYRGPLLESCPEEWILPEREARQQAYFHALETLAADAIAHTHYGEAARYLHQLLASDPARESAVCALMQTLAAQGDTAAITQVYRNFRLYLHQELNTAPAEQTAALYRQLSQTAPVHAAAFPAAPPTAGLTRRLPVPLTPLIGREEEIEAVCACLQAHRLVTLTGTGGVGKTRLAIAVAENALNRFADGVWFVDLAPLADPALVPRAIASTLGMHEESNRTLEQTLTAFLHPKSALLLLDNCEHLIDASAHWVNVLLKHCPDIRLVATSREALQVLGEQVVRVPSLPVPSEAELSGNEKNLASVLLEFASVRLFVTSATSVRATFRLTPQNAKAVASLCHRLDGIPLALELAAARIGSLSIEEINNRLSERFRLLTGGRRPNLPRHQTLRALIDWSYDLLTEPEKTLLCRLSVFAGGWTLQAAEAVCSGVGCRVSGVGDMPGDAGAVLSRNAVSPYKSPTPNTRNQKPETRNRYPTPDTRYPTPEEVLEWLLSLVDKSLVMFEEQANGTSRYRLLETIRQYGLERLEKAGELAAWRRRHRDYFLGLAEEAESQLYGQEQADWLERLETEHDNLRAAIGWCLEEGAEAGLRLTGSLLRFWDVRGHFSEGREWIMAVLARPDAQAPTQARAKALLGAGLFARRQTEYTLAAALHEESLAICRGLGEPLGIARALGNLGLVAWDQGRYAQARSHYEEALEIFRELGDNRRIAATLHALALVTGDQGDYARARSLYEEVLAMYREMEDKRHIATVLHSLGFMLREKHDYGRARSLSEESLAMCRELGDKQGIASSLTNLGEVARELGDYELARSLYEESLAISREMGERTGIALSIANLGLVACALGDYARARSLGEESLAICRELGSQRHIAAVLNDLGKVAAHQGETVAAQTRYAESLTIRRELGDKLGIALSLEAFADLLTVQGQFGRAARLWGAAEALRQAILAPLSPKERETYDRSLTAARTALGEEAFAAAWAEGQAMSLEEASAYALEPAA